MASTKTRKPAPRKKRTVRKKKKAPRFFGQISLSRVLLYLALVIFFFVSIAAAGYVIFFRVVVAAEAERSISRPHVAIILEDMGQPAGNQEYTVLNQPMKGSGKLQGGVK